MKVFAEKLGYEQRKFMNFLKKCGFHGNQWTSNLALYLKMLVLVTAINVPNLCLYQKVHNLPEISSYDTRLHLQIIFNSNRTDDSQKPAKANVTSSLSNLFVDSKVLEICVSCLL